MSIKYYAVARGRTIGVFTDWKSCQESITGFSNQKYQKFDTEQEALDFINNYSSEEPKAEIISKTSHRNIEEVVDYDSMVLNDLNEGRVVAFTDGSYSGVTKFSGYGIYILTSDQKPVEISDRVYSKRFESSNNIAPEVFAVIEALKWAASNEYDKITIYHDLQLLGNWADGSNKAHSEIGKIFLRELNEKYSTLLDIRFQWVKGHSGVTYNEIADSLASEVIKNRKPVGKYGPNSFYGQGVSKKKVLEILSFFEDKEGVSITNTILANGTKFQIKSKNEKLTVTYFDGTGATWLQGEVKALFSEFLSMYTSHIPAFEMIRAYSDTYKEHRTIEESNAFIETLNLPSDYPESGIILLRQGYLMRKMNREEVDYGHYTSPSYRALEGHIKYLCSKAGHSVTRNTLGSVFINDPNTPGRKILECRTLKNHTHSTAIENAYNVHFSKRHPISHFGDVLVAGFEDTLLIPNIEEAHDRIDEVVNLIKF